MASKIIGAVQTISGNQPRVRRIAEKATQTFLRGTPVQISSLGFVQEWDGTSVTAGIAGFSLTNGANLTTAGVPKTLTTGQAVPNQASAVIIPIGAPLNDGRVDFEVAAQDTVFSGMVGPAQVAVQADIGVAYGMTKDSDGYWYVDRTNTATPVCRVVKLDPADLSTSPRGVYFTILPTAAQIVA